jgi:hypothetical protein
LNDEVRVVEVVDCVSYFRWGYEKVLADILKTKLIDKAWGTQVEDVVCGLKLGLVGIFNEKR